MAGRAVLSYVSRRSRIIGSGLSCRNTIIPPSSCIQCNSYQQLVTTKPHYFLHKRALSTTEVSETKKISDENNPKAEETEETPPWQNPNAETLDGRIFEDEFKEGEEIPYAQLPPQFDTDSGKVMADPKLHDLAVEVMNLKLIETQKLALMLMEHFGINAEQLQGDIGGGSAGPAGEGGDAAPVEEEKTIFDLQLASFDAKSKIKVIKEVRAITGLGLKEAKEMVEGAPKVIMKGIKKEEAEELKAKVEAVGGVVEIV